MTADQLPGTAKADGSPRQAQTALGSVGKAAALLSSFTPARSTVGVSELARSAGIPKSTAHRLLAILVDWELVTKSGTDYSPGPRLAELAHLTKHADHQELREAAMPYLLELYERTHETVHLAVLEGRSVLYIEKIQGHNRVESPSRIGGRLPAAACALGKAMLAFGEHEMVSAICGQLSPITAYTIVSPRRLIQELAAVREQGVSFDRQESQSGLTCVAAPALSWTGRALAAVSVSGPSNRFQPAKYVAAVRHAAAGVASDYQRFSEPARSSRRAG